VVLRGQIDLWFEEGGELILVDYKTDDVGPEEAVTRADSYALQLRLYALALERCAGRLPDRAYVCLLRPNVAVPIALSAPLVADAGDVVRAMRKAQSEMKFELQDGDHCLRCPFYRGLCPAILLSKAVMRRECNSLGSGSGSRPL
jgi:CRISPR/Cas system-associated exonuclease Cas4 (RecB family)